LVAPGAGVDLGVDVGRIHLVPGNASTSPIVLDPRVFARVRRAVADADIVHLHEPLMPMVGWAGLTADAPMVCTFHAAIPSWVALAYRWAAAPIGRRLRRAVLSAVSEEAAWRIPPGWGEVTLIPNGLDVAGYQPEVDRIEERVVFVGRDDPRKGLDVLLRAWPEVVARIPEAELVVVGSGRADRLPGVTFLGPTDEGAKRRVMGSSSLLVAPNLGGESFGIVIAEAMAAGCAVVASDLPAFRALAGDDGRYFPAGDSTRLATIISSLLARPSELASLRWSARKRVERLDWSVVVPRYLEIYQKAASGKREQDG
jgi:phosphatidylinositol alpha-mannosyltransferase